MGDESGTSGLMELLGDGMDAEEESKAEEGRRLREQLTPRTLQRMGVLAEHLDAVAEKRARVWVMDGRHKGGRGAEAEAAAPFATVVSSRTTVEQLATLVEQRFGVKADGLAAVLSYNGKRLEAGTRLFDYGLGEHRGKWSSPYAGVVWLLPRAVNARYATKSYFSDPVRLPKEVGGRGTPPARA